MIVWREILQSIGATVHKDSTLHEAITTLHEYQSEIALVCDDENFVGYVNLASVLQQLRNSPDLEQKIEYQRDILKVPESHPVEFYYNISAVIGVDETGQVVGFSTVQEARNKINQLHFEQMNRILNGAGIGIITTNSDLEITFINEMAETILGLSKSFLLSRNYKTLLTVNQNIEQVLAGKQFISVDSSLNFKQIIGNFTPLLTNGEISGVVHIFFLREQFEEAVQELEFVRNLNEDLQAIYSSSNEQILVVNSAGDVIRLAGTFLQDFWMVERPEQVIGKNVREFEEKGIFRPNIFDLCIKQQKKLTCIQETLQGRRIWSVANPVFHDEKLQKIIVISRDITEINQLREKLEMAQRKSEEYKQELNEFITNSKTKKDLIYRSRVMEDLVDEMRRIAAADSTVLLNGESGVGKEVFAQAIHESSKRKDQPFIRVNCGAIPDNLIESELFGYEKGAFTGADHKGKPGLFEMANQGTIFLDEIAELPLNMQVKLLRVLQEREVVRVGGVKTIPIDVRVIAATNRNLWELVQENRFREDLYYRLNVIPLRIPPLRERIQDIVSLSVHFLQKFNRIYLKEKSLSREALEVLENYNWPGNVRELQNIIERMVVTTRNDFITRDDVLTLFYGERKGRRPKAMVFELMPLKEAVAELEKQLIQLGLQKYGTATKVSEILGVSQATISRRINKLMK
ncbi:sigma 54-interacting transcriptional regulator [Effusibacillus consociatus]|uniref:HTH-type transcriptional regulatory protein TyrR n=1 Tax=Effusibacillus consociatus TaxID=1117041 RepID=A0ABV9PZ11_9BACL